MGTVEKEHFQGDASSAAEKGIEHIAEILSSETPVGRCPIVLVDRDYTTIEGEKLLWTDGQRRPIYPQTIAAFLAVHKAGVRLGVATEQAFTQLEPQLLDEARLALGKDMAAYDLFDGPIVGEGGGVVRRGKGKKQGQLVEMIHPEARRDRERMLEWLADNINDISPYDGGWGVLDGVDAQIGTPVKLPSPDFQGRATISLWERGPHVMDDPSYIARYAQVQARVEKAMRAMGITSLKAYEGGNGALRITPVDKGSTVSLLAIKGALDLSSVVFVCDGPNDRALAGVVGGVIAVGNAIPEIKERAHYVAQAHAGLGFAEAIARIFPRQYSEALNNLNGRGLSLAG